MCPLPRKGKDPVVNFVDFVIHFSIYPITSLPLGTKHNLSSGSHRVKKSLFPFSHSGSPFFPFLPSFSPSPLGNLISNASTTFATTTFISIIAKYLPAQTVRPILNGRYALRSLTISGRLVHRSGAQSCGFSKYRSSC